MGDFDEKLIEAVRQNDLLYDKHKSSYQQPELKAAAWRQIAAKFGVTVWEKIYKHCIMSRFNNGYGAGGLQEQLVADTYNILERSSASIQRSNQIAIETEQIGTEVLSELGEQRESLLRSTRRLENAEDDMSKSRAIIRKLRREVLYNKLILVLIIVLEIGVLAGLVVIKFVLK